MIFLFPLALSLAAALMFLIGDFALPTKGFYVGLTALAAALQFVPALRAEVHFLVPLGLQLFVCGAWYFCNAMD